MESTKAIAESTAAAFLATKMEREQFTRATGLDIDAEGRIVWPKQPRRALRVSSSELAVRR